MRRRILCGGGGGGSVVGDAIPFFCHDRRGKKNKNKK